MVITLFAVCCGTHKNVAWTVHFEPLLDQNLLIAGSNPMRDHPGCATSGGGPSRRIVSVVKNHAGMKPSLGIVGFATNKVNEFHVAARQIFRSATNVEAKTLQRL